MKTDQTRTIKNTLLALAKGDSKAVLDIGCGNGEFTFILSQKVKSIVGIDPEENSIRSARRNFKSDNVTFQVGCAESLEFSSSSFDTVVFCQSLHHIPLKFQENALNEARRVLKAGGKLLIIEPIYGKGSLEEIENLYIDEKDERFAARNLVGTIMNDKFTLELQKEIRIQETCDGFEDLYRNSIQPKPYAKWDDSLKDAIVRILNRCDKTASGEIIMEYFATVWLFRKSEL